MPLARARDGVPQEGLASLLWSGRAQELLLVLFLGPALRAGTGPQRWVAEDQRAGDREERPPPLGVASTYAV